MKHWLIDTGPLVAYLDSNDDAHRAVAACWSEFTGQSLTTGAVITEAMHFVTPAPDGPAVLAELVNSGRIRVYDLCQPAALTEAAELMARHRDTPMDFADATLVLLADALDVRDILTLDRRGFATYRTPRRRALRMVLDS